MHRKRGSKGSRIHGRNPGGVYRQLLEVFQSGMPWLAGDKKCEFDCPKGRVGPLYLFDVPDLKTGA